MLQTIIGKKLKVLAIAVMVALSTTFLVTNSFEEWIAGKFICFCRG